MSGRRRLAAGAGVAAVLAGAALAGAAAAQKSPVTPATPGHVGPPPGALERTGYRAYGQYCVACHGANGAGIAQTGTSRIGSGPTRVQAQQAGYGPSLRGVGALAADFYLRTGYMPLPHVGVQPRRRSDLLLDDDQIRALVAYIAWLAPGPPVPKPSPQTASISEGMHLFTDRCAGCHQIVAQGGYVTGAVAPPLEDATPTQVEEAIRIGPFVMPRFSKKDLSDAQVDSIVRYVQYAAKRPSQKGGWGIGFIGPIPEGMVAWFLGGAAVILVCMAIGRRLKE